MKIFVDCYAQREGDGSEERPFKRINEAAQHAKPGDEVIVLPGVYREHVNPKWSGTEDAPIHYRSLEPLGAKITGAEPLTSWEHVEGDVWSTRVPNGVFGNYNPYNTVIGGDWYMASEDWHAGEIFLEGRSLFEVEDLGQVMNPDIYRPSWEDHGWSQMKWHCSQEDDSTVFHINLLGKNPNEENIEFTVRRRCFFPEVTGIDYLTVSGFVLTQAATTWAPPTAFQDGLIGPHWSKGWIIEDCEISESKCSGISLGKYLQPTNENKWSRFKLKDGTQNERDAICQAQYEGWTKEQIGSHIVRRCHIHHCEQTGIVGHLGGVFSLIEDNEIHHINTKQQLRGAEVGGIKMHAAIDVIFRRNHIHHCSRGLWLDWQAQGTRVTQNLMHDNMPPVESKHTYGYTMCEDLFVEVSHGPTLVDHNIFLSTCSGRLSTQGVAYVHNLIAGSFTAVGAGVDHPNGQPRYTPYHVPHRTEIAGFMSFLHGDNRFYNNIFVNPEVPDEYREIRDWATGDFNWVSGTHPFDGYPTEDEWLELFDEEKQAFADPTGASSLRYERYFHKLPVWASGNVYFNGAKPYDKEQNFFLSDEDVSLTLVQQDGSYVLETNIWEHIPDLETTTISTELLGEAFEPEQMFENPDGSPIVFDRDYFEDKHAVRPFPGPFAGAEQAKRQLF